MEASLMHLNAIVSHKVRNAAFGLGDYVRDTAIDQCNIRKVFLQSDAMCNLIKDDVTSFFVRITF